MTSSADDLTVVETLNSPADAGLRLVGRAEEGTLGGAILVQLPSGQPGVVTRYLGTLADAQRASSVLDQVRRWGLPVPLDRFVVVSGEDVFLVQEQLPGSPPKCWVAAGTRTAQ